ncbi:hypothetical protein Pint_25398 [Pistacia integerrima]|uniref:Uncharacterized protein n=1 Tax=Pistacia integerrima TaxID=434235 RepID=A0ACC0YI21_9ROSI|nr:hypothetical protein Pint_25398 [Pistacia integerrima]
MEGMHNFWSRAASGGRITMRLGRWKASPVEYATAGLWEIFGASFCVKVACLCPRIVGQFEQMSVKIALPVVATLQTLCTLGWYGGTPLQANSRNPHPTTTTTTCGSRQSQRPSRPTRRMGVKGFVEGNITSIVVGCSTHPLDLLKVCMQLQGEP